VRSVKKQNTREGERGHGILWSYASAAQLKLFTYINPVSIIWQSADSTV